MDVEVSAPTALVRGGHMGAVNPCLRILRLRGHLSWTGVEQGYGPRWVFCLTQCGKSHVK